MKHKSDYNISILIEEQSSESDESDLDESNVTKFNHQDDQPALTRKKNIETLISKQNRLNTQNEYHQRFEMSENNNKETRKIINHQLLNATNSQSNITNGLNGNGAVRRGSFFKSTDLIKLKNTKINAGALQGLNIFHRKRQHGFVDVWWLYDDGGLTILLPYLLKQKKYWEKCKLRIFIQTKSENANISEEQRNMAMLLSKFRIEFHDLIVFSTINRKPQPARLVIEKYKFLTT